MRYTTDAPRAKCRPHGRVAGAGLVAIALLLAACSGDGATEAPAEAEPTSEPSEATEAEESAAEIVEGDDGVLEPLPSGFPDAPITLWAAYDPGHTDDMLNRLVAEIASEYSPVRITTDTEPAGGDGSLAFVDTSLQYLPRAEEGYHLYVANVLAQAIRPYMSETAAAYDVDLQNPIVGLVRRPFLFNVPLDSPFDSLEDLEDAARANPGGLRFAAGGATSTVTLTGLVWMDNADIDLTVVPVANAAEGRTVMLGGGSEIGIWSYYPGVEEEYKIIAHTGGDRIDVLPDVPTTSEAGHPNLRSGSLSAYGTLPTVPQEHQDWLAELMRLVVEDPRFIAEYEGAEVRYMARDEVRDAMEADVEAFYPVLDSLDLIVNPR